MKALVRVLIAAVVLAGGYAGYLWLRDSPLMEVRKTTVEGVSGYQAGQIRAQLESAAEGLSTMSPDVSVLRAAVNRFPTVQSVTVDGHPPHGLTITVQINKPIALLINGTKRVAVAGDGRLLPGVPAGSVPTVPTKSDLTGGAALLGETKLVLAGLRKAPASIRDQIAFAGVARDTGLTFQLKSGVELHFGDGARLNAKWLAATAVLSDPEAAKATYIDVRSPERPAAGGLQQAATDGATTEPDPGAGADLQPQVQP